MALTCSLNRLCSVYLASGSWENCDQGQSVQVTLRIIYLPALCSMTWGERAGDRETCLGDCQQLRKYPEGRWDASL